MSFLRRLFGKKPKSAEASPPEANPTVASGDRKEQFQVFDRYGREMFISRADWEKNVLPGTIKDAWNNPERLYTVLVGSLNDGFRNPQITAAAEHLYQTDSEPHRGEVLWGIMLMHQGRLDEAEKILREALKRHGEDGSTLTNLAKIYFQRNDGETTEAIMRRALEVDPNQENGLAFYRAIRREKGGDVADRQALQEIAASPKSWLSQLWLARMALDSGQTAEAQALYCEALAHADRPVPGDLLGQISGDLGQRGYLATLLELTESHFDAAEHGLPAGNNLIRANIELGRFDEARRILDELYARKRPDWASSLSFWDTEIAKARIKEQPVPQTNQMQMAMLRIDGPIWLGPDSIALPLFPTTEAREPTICFLGSSVEKADPSGTAQRQITDVPGRISRALPLYLTEQIYFGTQAQVQTWVPWLQPQSGFVLSGKAWKSETATEYCQQFGTEIDVAVMTHLRMVSEPWTVEVRVIRVSDASVMARTSLEFPQETPGPALVELARWLLQQLATHLGLQVHFSGRYRVPSPANLAPYLVRLEQLLAVRCAGMEETKGNFLSGEREILSGNLQFCVECPDNVATRILLAETVASMNKVRPDVVQEFRDSLLLLERHHPLDDDVAGIVKTIYEQIGFAL